MLSVLTALLALIVPSVLIVLSVLRVPAETIGMQRYF
jgi:hypothetical protein